MEVNSANLQQIVQDLADRAALDALIAAYARAADDRDFVAWQALFTDDGGYGPPGFRIRRELLVEAGERLNARFVRTQHVLGQHLVEINGDEATGRCYFVAYHLKGTAFDSGRANLGGWYLNSYRRTPEGWRISNVTGEVVWQEGDDYVAAAAPILTDILKRDAAA